MAPTDFRSGVQNDTLEAQLAQVLERFRERYGRNVQSYYPHYEWLSKSRLTKGLIW